LRAGKLLEGAVIDIATGAPQGTVISPLLSNIYLHPIDLLFWDQEVRGTKMVRCAGDLVVSCRWRPAEELYAETPGDAGSTTRSPSMMTRRASCPPARLRKMQTPVARGLALRALASLDAAHPGQNPNAHRSGNANFTPGTDCTAVDGGACRGVGRGLRDIMVNARRHFECHSACQATVNEHRVQTAFDI